MRAAAAIGLTSVFAVVLFRVDMTMLAAFEPNDVVGDYGAAYRLLEATLFVSWSVSSAVFPVFSRLSLTSVPSVGYVFERGVKLGVALTLPLAAGACRARRSGRPHALRLGLRDGGRRLADPRTRDRALPGLLRGRLAARLAAPPAGDAGRLRARRRREHPCEPGAHPLAVARGRGARDVDLAGARDRRLARGRATGRGPRRVGTHRRRARSSRPSLPRWRCSRFATT